MDWMRMDWIEFDFIEWMMMMLARVTQFARSLGAVRIGQSGGLIIYHTTPTQLNHFIFIFDIKHPI